MNRITVLLAEDHMVVREGFRRLLESDKDVRVIGEAETGRQAVQMCVKLRPDVVVMDIAMPLLNGLEAARQIRKALPGTKVLILSAHSDDVYIEQAIEFGAAGFLVKQTSSHKLSKAIRAVHRGKTFFSPAVSRRIESDYQRSPVTGELVKKKSARLTSREVEVLQLIAEGSANKQAAAKLGISIKTVEKHRDHLMRKLDIHDTAGLTRYAIEAGVVEGSVQLTIV